MNNIALDGVTVIDLGRVISGSYCTMMFADMGARVIKIENTEGLDTARILGPHQKGESGYFMTINRNKESITLNLKTEEGKEILRSLIREGDIFVENFRPGVMKKLGFDYEEVKKINPAMVYASISGFGQYGPYAERPSYDVLSTAMGGLMAVTGEPDGGPMKIGANIGDATSGLMAAIGVLAAYSKRLKTGIGQYIDISMADSIFSLLATRNHTYFITGELPPRHGNRDELSCPYGVYEANDGYLVIGCAHRRFFLRLADIMEMPELAEDPRFCTHELCAENHLELDPIVEKWCMERDVASIVKSLTDVGIPCAPVYNVAQIAEDPQIAGARNMCPVQDHPFVGKVRLTGNPIKMSDTPTEDIRIPSPMLGQHTDAVLKEFLGYDDAKIANLRQRGVIGSEKY
ncbi:MAG: CoA transferase [Clostridiales Family XIII bacterium]|jgi:formyl-CoA transferase|nr:CoA transferase [Clostridiales Family XIII bacterium]